MASRTPTNVLQLTHSLDKRPQRAAERANEPKPSGDIGDAPKEFKKKEREIWDELVRNSPAGVLTNADRFMLMTVVKLQAKVLTGKASSNDYGNLMRGLGKLGLNPSDRSRVKSAAEPTKNPFAALDE